MTTRLLFGTYSAGTKANYSKKNALKLLILEELYRHGCKSIPELSKIIRMSTPTITRAIDELIGESLLVEDGIGSSSGGRRPNLYGINPSSRYVLGIDICRYSVRYGLFNFHNEPAAEIRVLNEGLDTTKDIIGAIKTAVDQYIEEGHIS